MSPLLERKKVDLHVVVSITVAFLLLGLGLGVELNRLSIHPFHTFFRGSPGAEAQSVGDQSGRCRPGIRWQGD
jgi:hypothetical protein